MIGWIIAGVVILLVCLLGSLRLGVGGSHTQEEGIRVWLRLGPAKITLYPRPKKEPSNPAREKKPKPPKEKKPEREKKPKKPLTSEQIIALVRQLIPLGLEAAGSFRRKLRIDVLDARRGVGEPDPADAALHYGQASAALGALWGPLNQAVQIKDGRARVDVDFQQDHWVLWGRLQMTLTVGQLVWLGLRYGAAVLHILRETRKESKKEQRKAA